LLREADTALYTAKEQGKGRWREYREGMPTPSRRYIDARRTLDDAVKADKLTLHYQPIVEVASGQVIGFEALIRVERQPDHPETIRTRTIRHAALFRRRG
jgi:predicted signal transduction protein with EAL and GGDEF domain